MATAIGFFSRGHDWLAAVAIVSSQVMTMMVTSGELGGLSPLAVVLPSFLSALFVVASFADTQLRSAR